MLASFKAMGDLPLPFPTLFISKMLADALFPLSIPDRYVCTFYFTFFFWSGNCFPTLLFKMSLGDTKRCFVSGFMHFYIYLEVLLV